MKVVEWWFSFFNSEKNERRIADCEQVEIFGSKQLYLSFTIIVAAIAGVIYDTARALGEDRRQSMATNAMCEYPVIIIIDSTAPISDTSAELAQPPPNIPYILIVLICVLCYSWNLWNAYTQ